MTRNPNTKIAFITATEDLKKQAIDDFSDYLPDLSTLTIASLNEDIKSQLTDLYDMFIFDEADQLLQKMSLYEQTVRKQTQTLGGLLSPFNNGAKTYFFSATYSNLAISMLKMLFSTDIIQF